uniref:4-coumarate--CoA ligase n=1 Tax=Daphnia magna TaxID=35525 RepID=A0A0P5EQT1_9CRUS
MSVHLRSTVRRALLLANRTGNGSIAITGQRAALGNASAMGSAAASPNPKPSIRTNVYENNIVTSPYADCEFHDMTLTQKFFESAVRWPDKIALECGISGRRYTYNTMSQAVCRFGSALTRMGFIQGEVMGIIAPNLPEFPIAMFGAAGAGMPVALVNPTYTADEIARQMTLVEATCLFGVSEMAETLKAVAQLCPTVRRIVLLGPSQDGCVSYQDMMQDSGDLFNDNIKIDIDNDIFILPHSSGTSGLPKNVMLTHSSVGKNIQQYLQSEGTNNRPATATHQETYIGLLPFFHSYGMVGLLLSAVESGAKLVTLPRFDVPSFLKAIDDHQPTYLHLVPPLVSLLTNLPELKAQSYSRVHTIFCGAAPLGAPLAIKLLERFTHPVSFQEAYGLTEMSPGVMMGPLGNKKLGSCGSLLSRTQAKIVDLETGQRTLGPHEDGELYVFGPQAMKGYYKNQQATDEMIGADGWLRTGDIGHYDEDGHFFIVDRLKELIKVNGFQVAPAELEEVLTTHPAIKEAAVIGIPDERVGELPRAYVVKKPGMESVGECDINAFVNAKVSAYKQIKGGIQFCDSVPRSNIGKILRRELRVQYANSCK